MTSSGVTKIRFCFEQTKVSWGIYRKLSLIIKEKPFSWGKIKDEKNLMKKV